MNERRISYPTSSDSVLSFLLFLFFYPFFLSFYSIFSPLRVMRLFLLLFLFLFIFCKAFIIPSQFQNVATLFRRLCTRMTSVISLQCISSLKTIPLVPDHLSIVSHKFCSLGNRTFGLVWLGLTRLEFIFKLGLYLFPTSNSKTERSENEWGYPIILGVCKCLVDIHCLPTQIAATLNRGNKEGILAARNVLTKEI